MFNNFKNKKIGSKFFKFLDKKKKDLKISSYSGWNKSLIVRILSDKSGIIDSEFIKKNFPKILNKEKIFIVTSGNPKFKSKRKFFNLKKFDAISIFSDNFDYNFECKKNDQLFIVSSEKFKKKKNKSIYFNFKKNIKEVNIWGGKILSRPYTGIDLNVVLFYLKPGFSFADQGHKNEQITWLISGSMNFYSGKIKDKLTKQNGVDIGSFHKHGGLSNGAVGFDAFFPKRAEKKYRHKVNALKF